MPTKIWNKLWSARCAAEYVLTQGYSEDEDGDSDYLDLCREISEGDTLVVSAFPATGKSYFFENSDMNVIDSDSSKFDKSEFPANYIEHIKKNIGTVSVILVSSHKEVRDALVENEIPFVLVYPDKELKEDYIERYKTRGSPPAFVELISSNWDDWIGELENQVGCYRYKLSSGEFLESLFEIQKECR